jgi:hypothetical protein
MRLTLVPHPLRVGDHVLEPLLGDHDGAPALLPEPPDRGHALVNPLVGAVRVGVEDAERIGDPEHHGRACRNRADPAREEQRRLREPTDGAIGARRFGSEDGERVGGEVGRPAVLGQDPRAFPCHRVDALLGLGECIELADVGEVRISDDPAIGRGPPPDPEDQLREPRLLGLDFPGHSRDRSVDLLGEGRRGDQPARHEIPELGDSREQPGLQLVGHERRALFGLNPERSRGEGGQELGPHDVRGPDCFGDRFGEVRRCGDLGRREHQRRGGEGGLCLGQSFLNARLHPRHERGHVERERDRHLGHVPGARQLPLGGPGRGADGGGIDSEGELLGDDLLDLAVELLELRDGRVEPASDAGRVHFRGDQKLLSERHRSPPL